MKVVLLTLDIVCAIFFGINTVISTNVLSAIFSMIASILWSICVGMGVAGFVLALLGLILCWVPNLNWILWILGLVFSIIGMFKPKKGLAIAGLVISCLYILLLTVLASIILAAL